MTLSPIHVLAAGLVFWILAALWAVGGMPAVLLSVLLIETLFRSAVLLTQRR